MKQIIAFFFIIYSITAFSQIKVNIPKPTNKSKKEKTEV